MNRQLQCAAAALLGVAWTVPAAASESGHACASIADDQRRLACYDEAFGQPVSVVPTVAAPAVASSAAVAGSGTPAVASAAAVSSAATTGAVDPQADFGLSEQAKVARDPEKAKLTNPDSITATVTEVGKRPRGEFIVTLDNGHVWMQSETNSRARLAVGDTVTIKKGALASYLLITPSKVATRVKRVE